MSTLDQWSLIVGFLAPLLIGVIQQPGWSNGLRSFVMFLFCIVAAGITQYLNGGLHFDNMTSTLSSVMVVIVAAIASYKGFWKPTGIVPAIEASTSPQLRP